MLCYAEKSIQKKQSLINTLHIHIHVAVAAAIVVDSDGGDLLWFD
jgi:hypothetical protein